MSQTVNQPGFESGGVSRFFRAVRSEWRKVFSTRSWWVLTLVMGLYLAFVAALISFMFTSAGDMLQGVDELPADAPVTDFVYTLGLSIGYIFPTLLGALAVTSEYRHHTMGNTFLAVGSRDPVLGAKVTVQGLLGAFLGVVALATTVVVAAPFFLAADLPSGLVAGETWAMFLRLVLAMGIWAVIGVGLAALIRNQATVIALVLVFTQMVEPTLRMLGSSNSFAASVTKFLPGAVSDAFVGDTFYTVLAQEGHYAQLSPWLAGSLLLIYALLLVAAAWFFTWNKDLPDN